ncbi:MAG: GspE/PulE family protein [Candidatus Omnitrophica bacterium]|nr:GspE/PulE family protein [Candidatus Omnitrophota bacterium]
MSNLSSNIPMIDLSNYIIDPEALKSIPEELAREYKVIPLFRVRDTLTVAIADPSDVIAIDKVRAVTGCDIQTLMASEDEIKMAIDHNYNVGASLEQIIKNLKGMDFNIEKISDANRVQKIVEEPPIIKLVNLIIYQALKDRASDIHIEPTQKKVNVRLRIDGVLHDVFSLPLEIHMPMVCRIKVISRLDIVESRRPQDGHFYMRVGQRDVDFRVSTLPLAFGEKVVIRILDRSTAFLTLDKLGFSEEALKKFESMIKKPYGIILVTGPTGSGKTSTLYAALSRLNSRDKNIVTLEDPREYILEGINQAEINTAIDFTFANGLRSILRQDPDIIMIGEIRDTETAQIAIRSALTGHLVLSSLHTNDAAGAITRLIDMGVEPFLIASSLIGVLAQRLVRVICSNCKQQYQPEEEVYNKLSLDKDNRISLYRGKGCIQCRHTGYKGRVGIFEVLVMNEHLRELTTKNRPTIEIQQAAEQAGMITLKQDGYDKVMKGITTLEEVLRVVS